MLKKWLPTILILVILLGMGAYALFTMTDFPDQAKRFLAKSPDLETVNTYFPNEESQELGKITSSYTEGEQYLFMIRNNGISQLLILPKDFNAQDINKRTYMTLGSGTFIPNEEVHPFRISLKKQFLEEQDAEVMINSYHKLITYKEGSAEESLVDFYKVRYFEKDDELLFYQDNENKFEFKGEVEDIEILKNF